MQWTNYKGETKNLPQIPAVSDNTDFSQFVFPNDPSGICMVHIPYNHFCLFAMKREQTVYTKTLEEFSKLDGVSKEVINYLKHKIEK